jgi:hypothetical protein
MRNCGKCSRATRHCHSTNTTATGAWQALVKVAQPRAGRRL